MSTLGDKGSKNKTKQKPENHYNYINYYPQSLCCYLLKDFSGSCLLYFAQCI